MCMFCLCSDTIMSGIIVVFFYCGHRVALSDVMFYKGICAYQENTKAC